MTAGTLWETDGATALEKIRQACLTATAGIKRSKQTGYQQRKVQRKSHSIRFATPAVGIGLQRKPANRVITAVGIKVIFPAGSEVVLCRKLVRVLPASRLVSSEI